MTEIERAIDILQDSNKLLLMQIDKVKSMARKTHVRLAPYDKLERCESEYKAVETAITALRQMQEREKGCKYCGAAKLSEMAFCPNCGRELKVRGETS